MVITLTFIMVEVADITVAVTVETDTLPIMVVLVVVTLQLQKLRENMDLRIMQYFLAVVREGNISAASEALHVAQPSLSRQMKELEEELGATLFIRGNRKITLTEEGMVLRKRAEEIVGLIQRTEEEISQTRGQITGTIRIGAGESRVFSFISKAASRLSENYPGITINIKSGDTIDLMDEIANGILDFAIVFSDVDETRYDSITLPMADTYGILMRKDSPFASKKSINSEVFRCLKSNMMKNRLSYQEARRDILKMTGSYQSFVL